MPEGVSTITVVAAQTVTSQAAPAASPTALEDYGLMDSFRQAQANLSGTLQDFVGKLGQFLSKALTRPPALRSLPTSAMT